MAFDDLAQKLFGARRAESNAVLTDATTGTIHGTALTDSADGAVTIEIDGDVTVPEEIEVDGEVYYGGSGVGIEVPTSENVKAGDEVLVSVYGEGTMRSPAVTSAIGSGDRIAANASAAREIAEATGQHFWDDTNGAHVTEVTREEWEDSTSPNYHSGPNSIWNSLGMLFRDGLTNLMAILTNGLAIYDGNGNDAENVVASFTGTEVSLGANSNSSTIDMCGGAFKFYIDTSDPDNVLASIRLAQEAVDHSTANSPVLRLLSGTSSSGTGIEIRGTNASQYPISVIRYSGSSITRQVGFGALGINTSVIRLNSANCEIYKDSTDDIIHMKATRVVLPVETVSLTRGSGASSWVAGQLKRSGNTVVVTVQDFKLASALASGSNSGAIATIPAGYRPDAVQRVPAALSVNGNYANVWAAIGTSGAIVLANHSGLSIPTTATISLNCTYIID